MIIDKKKTMLKILVSFVLSPNFSYFIDFPDNGEPELEYKLEGWRSL